MDAPKSLLIYGSRLQTKESSEIISQVKYVWEGQRERKLANKGIYFDRKSTNRLYLSKIKLQNCPNNWKISHEWICEIKKQLLSIYGIA